MAFILYGLTDTEDSNYTRLLTPLALTESEGTTNPQETEGTEETTNPQETERIERIERTNNHQETRETEEIDYTRPPTPLVPVEPDENFERMFRQGGSEYEYDWIENPSINMPRPAARYLGQRAKPCQTERSNRQGLDTRVPLMLRITRVERKKSGIREIRGLRVTGVKRNGSGARAPKVLKVKMVNRNHPHSNVLWVTGVRRNHRRYV